MNGKSYSKAIGIISWIKWSLKTLAQVITYDILITSLVLCLYISTLCVQVVTHDRYSQVSSLINDSKYFVSRTIAIGSLEKLPDNHIDIIKNSGYDIQINDLKIYEFREKLGREKLVGLIHYNDKKIYLSSDIGTIDTVILHEIGHLMSRLDNSILSDIVFQECYSLEKHKIRDYAKNNIGEYFADIYMLQFVEHYDLAYDADDFPLSSNYLISLEWW